MFKTGLIPASLRKGKEYMKERKQLIEYLFAKESLQSRIKTAKQRYITACQDTPLIYISDHATVRYMERVQHIQFTEGEDGDKLHQYTRENNINIRKLRSEILSNPEMRHIVENEIKRYTKQGFTYIIDKLSLITVHPTG